MIVDIASRFMILRKLKTKQMEEVAMVLLEVFADFGVPKSVQHDQDPLFMNQVLDRLRQATHWKTKAVMCYFPSQNGAVERYVGEFKKVLYKLINGESYNWDLYVPVVQMSLNQLILPRHKSAPFSVMFARKANKFENYESVRKELSSVDDLMERNDSHQHSSSSSDTPSTPDEDTSTQPDEETLEESQPSSPKPPSSSNNQPPTHQYSL